eukprot:3297908-Amphidinium_carterae.1
MPFAYSLWQRSSSLVVGCAQKLPLRWRGVELASGLHNNPARPQVRRELFKTSNIRGNLLWGSLP